MNFLKAAYIQDDIRTAIKTVNEVFELVTFASELWNENTEVLSENCIKTTHKAAELLVCFVRFLMNDGSVAKASEEVLEDMVGVRVKELTAVFKVFVEGFLKAFLEVVELVEVVIEKAVELKVNFVSTLEELKIVAKGLKVPLYASFKSVENLQKAIDKRIAA